MKGITTMVKYPELLKQHLAAGMTTAQAQRAVYRSHPGLRRAWELEQRSGNSAPASADAVDISGLSPEVVRLVQKIEADKAAAGAGSQADYEPVTSETVRRAHGLSKAQWEARKQSAATPAASDSTTGGEPDYFQLIARVKRERGCDFATAAAEVNRTHPRSWAQMLSKANGGRDFSDRIRE